MSSVSPRVMRWSLLAVAFFSTQVLAAHPTLQQGELSLTWTEADGARPRLARADTSSLSTAAVVLHVVSEEAGSPARIAVNYASVERVPEGVRAKATLVTPAGSAIEVIDHWTLSGDEAVLRRALRVIRAVGPDHAFDSEVEWSVPQAAALAQLDVFMPGVWYATAADTPASGLIHDLGQRDFILREDRLALPLVSARDRGSGETITIEHRAVDGATITRDDDPGRVVDDRLRFGAIGVRREADRLRVVFRYPGSEGEQTSIFGYKPDRRTAERFHPLKPGQTQSYTLALRLSRHDRFADQLKAAWRTAFDAAEVDIVPADIAATYRASVDVLSHYAYTQGAVSGIPFAVTLPDGKVKDTSLQMGFVGQQLPCASYLIDEGLRTSTPRLVTQGERIIDFWVRESFSDKGVPRTWFDLDPEPRFRNYNTYLRVVTDGASGLLRAWQIERAAGREKRHWLAFSRRIGNWLLRIQNADGSFFREWSFDNKPASQSKTNTLHPVRFLVDLSCATGDMKYRQAALRAADFALAANQSGARYVGGTPDNPDVVDKEAGFIAMESYLALYDVTQEKRWLDAAVDAANFTETWVYAWNVPLPLDKPQVGVPRVKTFVGANLIATGHSGADNFLAYASFAYLRLGIYTGDAHYRDLARLLQHHAAQFVDVDGSLGYARTGLCVEAFSLAVNRGHSVGVWLPWLTSAVLEPMSRSRDVFGEIDVDRVAAMDAPSLQTKNRAFARTRGYAD